MFSLTLLQFKAVDFSFSKMFTPRLSDRLKSKKRGVDQGVKKMIEAEENPDDLDKFDFEPEPTLLYDSSCKYLNFT